MKKLADNDWFTAWFLTMPSMFLGWLWHPPVTAWDEVLISTSWLHLPLLWLLHRKVNINIKGER